MSQRIGMADGRCITDFNSSRIMNDFVIFRVPFSCSNWNSGFNDENAIHKFWKICKEII